LVLAFYAIFIYPISILLRAIAWRSLGKQKENSFLKNTGIAVLVLGLIMYFLLFGAGDALSSLEAGAILVPVALWVIYSILEFKGYWILCKGKKGFAIARVSIIGVGLSYLALFITAINSTASAFAIFILLRIGFLILTVSSAMAAYGFLKYEE